MGESTRRVSLDISEELHKQLKMVASARECSIRAYVLGHIKKCIERDMRQIHKEYADGADTGSTTRE